MAATVALTKDQYIEIIDTIKNGMAGIRPNPRIAAALQLEANLGLRIGDIVKSKGKDGKDHGLRLVDIVKDGGRYRLNLTEKKTGKQRTFTVPTEVYCFIRDYADDQGIDKADFLFPFTVRAVQKHLAKVCELLELDENISTHSFRKWYATDIYNSNGHDIALVQQLLQHSTTAVTRRYIGIADERIEEAIEKHTLLV